MHSRTALLGALSRICYFALLFGILGQAGMLGPILRRQFPSWLGAVIVTFPWLVVFTITFFKHYFLPPRYLRLSLLLAMCWFAAFAILAETLLALGQLPPEGPAYALTPTRCVMHLGWLAFIPLIRLYKDLGKLQPGKPAPVL